MRAQPHSLPATPAAAPFDRAQHLDAVLAALGLAATPEQRSQLLAYLDLLERWNRVYNLTAIRDPQQMLHVHLADCLALVPGIAARAPRRLLDVGSGGGLPGLVLAIMLPHMEVVLNDAVQKKCAFLQQVASELGLARVQAVHGRVEDLRLPPFDCITSRAFSDLATLVGLTAHLLAEQGCWAAMKGAAPHSELAALPDTLDTRIQALAVPGLEAQRCIVWIQRHPSPPSSHTAATREI